MLRLAWIAAMCAALWAGNACAQSVEFCSERSEEHARWTAERDGLAAMVQQIAEMASAGDEAAQVVLRSDRAQLDGFIAGLNRELANARQLLAQSSGSQRSVIQTMIVYTQAMLDLALDARARAEIGDQANADIRRFRERAAMARELNQQHARRVQSLTEDIASNRQQFAAMGCEQLLNRRPPVAGLAQVDVNGPWQTTMGRMTLTQTGDTVRGSYPGGRVEGVMSGNTLNARWIQSASGGWFQPGESCPTPYQESVHWGRLRIRFEVRAGQVRMTFEGRASQCFDELDAQRSLSLAGIQATD